MAAPTVDSLGRYPLSVMRDRIRRLLDAYAITVNTTTGSETIVQIQDQSFSNEDITAALNEALTALYLEMIDGKESLFSQTGYLSVGQWNPGPYSLPPNTHQLRWLKWKDPNTPFNPTSTSSYSPTPVQWRPMVLVDDPADTDFLEAYNSPTWRWEGGQILLNEVPDQINTNGIQYNIVALPKELVNDADVISIPQFVRSAQQCAIYDTAYTLSFSKKKKPTDELAGKRSEWHTRLITAVENAYNVSSANLVAPGRMIRDTYTGRFRSLNKGKWW